MVAVSVLMWALTLVCSLTLLLGTSPDESEPGTSLKDALARDFGSYDRWRSEFIAMGKALGGGSGWVLLSWSARDRKFVNQWASDHCHTLAGGTPILALDMYEHSYHIDYGAKAGEYVEVGTTYDVQLVAPLAGYLFAAAIA